MFGELLLHYDSQEFETVCVLQHYTVHRIMWDCSLSLEDSDLTRFSSEDHIICFGPASGWFKIFPHQLCCLPSGTWRHHGQKSTEQSAWLGRSSMYTRNSTGPSTKPRSTPDVTGSKSDWAPSSTTICTGCYVSSTEARFPYKERLTVCCINNTYDTQSKTLDKHKTQHAH